METTTEQKNSASRCGASSFGQTDLFKRVSSQMESHCFRTDEQICSERGAQRKLFYVAGGSVVRRIPNKDGWASTQLFLAGDWLNLQDVWSQAPTEFGFLCVSNAEIQSLDRETFQEHMKQDSQTSLLAFQECTRMIRLLYEESEILRNAKAADRVVYFLKRLAKFYGESDNKGGVYFSLPIAKKQLAQLSNVQPETLSRVLKQLQRDQVANHLGSVLYLQPSGLLY